MYRSSDNVKKRDLLSARRLAIAVTKPVADTVFNAVLGVKLVGFGEVGFITLPVLVLFSVSKTQTFCKNHRRRFFNWVQTSVQNFTH